MTTSPTQLLASNRYVLRKAGLPWSGERVTTLLLDKVILYRRELRSARRRGDLRGIEVAERRLSQLRDEAVGHLTTDERKALGRVLVEAGQ